MVKPVGEAPPLCRGAALLATVSILTLVPEVRAADFVEARTKSAFTEQVQLFRTYKGAGGIRWKATTVRVPSFPDGKAVVCFSAEGRQQADCIYSNGKEAVPRTVEVSELQT